MTHEPVYSDQLTGDEARLGFEVREVANPAGHFAFTAARVPAVILALGRSDRLVKLNPPWGGAAYQHERYGTAEGAGGADWWPVHDPYDTPEAALRAYHAGYQPGGPAHPAVTPLDPGVHY